MKTLKKVKKRAIKLPGKVEYTGTEPVRKGKIHLTLFSEGKIEHDHKSVAPSEVHNYIKEGSTCWISLDSISDANVLKDLGSVINIHPLFVSDMANADHQPKLHITERYIFLTLKGLHFNGNGIETEHLSLILGKGFVVSISERENKFFESFRETYLGETSLWNSTPDFLFSLLTDFVVTGYFTPISKIEEEMEEAEINLLQYSADIFSVKMLDIRKNLLIARKMIVALRDELSPLQKSPVAQLSPQSVMNFGNVIDHLNHLIQSIESYREINSGLVELSYAQTSHRMNKTITTLTIISTIFIPLTFVAGVYGMNFRYMPELEQKWGYPAIIIVMFAIGLGMFLSMKKRGFLKK